MISFKSVNLKIDFNCNDEIGILPYITPERLDYIFSTYLYYKQEENININYIKYIYTFKDTMISNVLIDNNLSNIEKIQIVYYMILSKFDSVDVSIITSIKYPDNISVIFNSATSINSRATFSKNIKSSSIINNKIDIISGITTNTIKITPVDDYLYTIQNKSIYEPIGYQYNQAYDNYYNNLFIIKQSTVTNDEYTAIKSNSEFISKYPLGYHAELVKYDGFVFLVNFNGNEQYIWLYGDSNNYILKSELVDIFNEMQLLLPPQVFSYNQYSYLMKKNKKYYMYISRYSSKEFTPDPFNRWDMKFIYQSIDKSSLPLPFSLSTTVLSSSYLTMGMFETTVSRKVVSVHDILYNYIITQYGSGSNSFINDEIYGIFIEKYLKIKKHINPITKELELWDVGGTFVNSSIGNSTDTEYADIQGFDSSTGLPILLQVSKQYDISNFKFRTYKISKGGIVPINNEDLNEKYSYDSFSYLLQLTANVTTYIGAWYSYDKLTQYIHNITYDFIATYQHNVSINSDVNLYLNFQKQTTPQTLPIFVYKNNGNKIIYICNKNESTPLLPYEMLISLVPANTIEGALTALDNIFTRATIPIDNTDFIYKNINSEYISLISSSKYYYLNSEIDRIPVSTNLAQVDILYNQIKQEQLTSLYKNQNMIEYTFTKVANLCTIDTTNYGDSESLFDMIMNTIDVSIYDTQDSSICTKDNMMSLIIKKDLYKISIDTYENSYLLSFQDFKKIQSTTDRILILNKVIGLDQFGMYSLYSDEIDNTFSDYFLNLRSNSIDIILLLDLENSKIRNISTNTLQFNANNNNPVTINTDLMKDKILYKFSKDQYDNVIEKYKTFSHIYDIDSAKIAYSYSSVSKSKGLVMNPNINDICIIEQ